MCSYTKVSLYSPMRANLAGFSARNKYSKTAVTLDKVCLVK